MYCSDIYLGINRGKVPDVDLAGDDEQQLLPDDSSSTITLLLVMDHMSM